MSRILVVEDNEALRKLLRDVLLGRNHEVDEARNGREALAKLQDAVPDLILVDIRMSDTDGCAVIRELRRDPRFAQLPVVAMTARAMESREEAGRGGFDAYISKPLDLASLVDKIDQILEAKAASFLRKSA